VVQVKLTKKNKFRRLYIAAKTMISINACHMCTQEIRYDAVRLQWTRLRTNLAQRHEVYWKRDVFNWMFSRWIWQRRLSIWLWKPLFRRVNLMSPRYAI